MGSRMHHSEKFDHIDLVLKKKYVKLGLARVRFYRKFFHAHTVFFSSRATQNFKGYTGVCSVLLDRGFPERYVDNKFYENFRDGAKFRRHFFFPK